jgi:uncharacterized membrane protein YidH (DUF202 family)
MNGDVAMERERPRSAMRIVVMTAVGLLVGLPMGWVVGKVLKAADLRTLPWSDQAAMALAMLFIATGALIAIFAATRRGQAILIDPNAPDYDRPARPGVAAYYLLQAAVLLLAGAMLAAPVVYLVIVNTTRADAGPTIMVAVLAGFALQTALNLAVWRRSDELMRRVISESAALCFWALQGVFFLWACGERLGVLPAISSWDAVTVMMGGYLIASTIVFYRRGLG